MTDASPEAHAALLDRARRNDFAGMSMQAIIWCLRMISEETMCRALDEWTAKASADLEEKYRKLEEAEL